MTDPLDLLAEALLTYLEEIDRDRHTCLRQEGTVAAHATAAALHLVRLFPWQEAILTHLRRVADVLPGWDTSPFWAADGRSWLELYGNTCRRQKAAGTELLMTRGITWEDRPVLVCVERLRPEDRLRVELLLPPVRHGLPELPLQMAACGVRCHEHLVPERIAPALPYGAAPAHPGASLRTYLMRAMPSNLYASQCFALPGAEN